MARRIQLAAPLRPRSRSRCCRDERNPVDYVFLSVDPAVTQEPRLDLLEQVRRVLTTAHGLRPREYSG
jgi:hypothetical protein